MPMLRRVEYCLELFQMPCRRLLTVSNPAKDTLYAVEETACTCQSRPTVAVSDNATKERNRTRNKVSVRYVRTQEPRWWFISV